MATSITGERTATGTQPADMAILELLPAQGEWSETAYLWLSGQTNRLVELVDGRIEVLPMPTKRHQAICRYLFLALLGLMQRIGGDVFFAPLRLRVGPRKFREPDLLLVRSADDPRARDEYWEGADLVVEIVSPDAPNRDYIDKRADYAEAGVLEYWIVDPQNETITVLQLIDDAYVEHGVFGSGTTASSALFADFQVAVDAVFDPA
jgi:Uma2 family endonuclease